MKIISIAALAVCAIAATGCASTQERAYASGNSGYYAGGGRVTGNRTGDAVIGGTAGAMTGSDCR